MLFRAAEDRRLYELEQQRIQEARWLQQHRAEQQRQQHAAQEWRRGQAYRLHQDQSPQGQYSHRPRDGWQGEARPSGWSRDIGLEAGAQVAREVAREEPGTDRDSDLQRRVVKKARAAKLEENSHQPAAAPGQDCQQLKRKAFAKDAAPDSASRSVSEGHAKAKDWTKDEDGARGVKGSYGKLCANPRGVLETPDGEEAGNPCAQVRNPDHVTSGNPAASIDMAKYEESCQSLMQFLVKGPSYLLNDVNHQELIAVQHAQRNVTELIDRAVQAAVQRELRATAAEKEELCRQRDAALEGRSTLANEICMLKQAQTAEIVTLRQAHEEALGHQKQEQDSMRKQLDAELHKSICKICLVKTRNAVLLPCMHFDYCLGCLTAHQTKHNTCPSCRGPIQGILQCNLGL